MLGDSDLKELVVDASVGSVSRPGGAAQAPRHVAGVLWEEGAAADRILVLKAMAFGAGDSRQEGSLEVNVDGRLRQLRSEPRACQAAVDASRTRLRWQRGRVCA